MGEPHREVSLRTHHAAAQPTLSCSIFFRSISTIRGAGRVIVTVKARASLSRQLSRAIGKKRGFTSV
jgi:hypothetical protein